MKEYEAIYSGYVHPKPKTNWSSDEEVAKTLRSVSISDSQTLDAGGLPIISDGSRACIDVSDNHCMIFGASGFKKSICVFMPLICFLAKAGENIVVTDPKGELYTRTASFLKRLGYRILVLNFRDYNGEGFNPLSFPAKLYRSGEIDKATTVSSNLVAALAQRHIEAGKADPFWPETAMAFNNGVLPLMYSSYPDVNAINFVNLADYYTNRTAEKLSVFVNRESELANSAMQCLRTVLSEPDKTLMSTLSTASSFVQPFFQNDKLARMLSRSTFELEELTEEKTALFIITDDSSSTCDPIVGILISQLQSVFLEKAFHAEDGKLSTRVNFVLDEFCSFPVPDIASALATHRSRNIRYYLCVQSLDLLAKQYPNYKNLITNCATSLFLGSTEMELLETISRRCGTTEITTSGHEEPLISVPELMTLRKDWYSKEVIYLNLASGIRYCTQLPSIEKYEAFCERGKADLPNKSYPPVRFYTFEHLLRDVADRKTNKPFYPLLRSEQELRRKAHDLKRKPPEGTGVVPDKNYEKRLSAALDGLLGKIDEEEDE